MLVNLNKLRRLSWLELRKLSQAAVVLPLIGLGLGCLGFRRLAGALGRFSGRGRQTAVASAEAGPGLILLTCRMLTLAAGHGPYRPTCLVRSLALWWLLRRQGVAADLHIGIKPSGESLEAHAWVSFKGRILNDLGDAPERFTPFPAVTPNPDFCR